MKEYRIKELIYREDKNGKSVSYMPSKNTLTLYVKTSYLENLWNKYRTSVPWKGVLK